MRRPKMFDLYAHVVMELGDEGEMEYVACIKDTNLPEFLQMKGRKVVYEEEKATSRKRMSNRVNISWVRARI